MATRWQVQVFEAGTTDRTDAAFVTFLPASEVAALDSFPFDQLTGSHQAGGDKIFRANEEPISIPKDWLLIVTGTGQSPVIQPIELIQRSVAQPVETRAAGGIEAATVEISRAEPRGGFDFLVTFTVTLHPASEVVFLSGTQYLSVGAPLREFAESRRADLYGKRIDDGTLVTIFSLDDRTRETFVKAKPRSDLTRWLRVHRAVKRPLPPNIRVTPGAPWTVVQPDGRETGITTELRRSFAISILDLYEYLKTVADTRPGTVKEVSIFSHGWRGGPILYNTSDGNSRAPARDQEDFDGRIKDFNGTQLAQFPGFAQAMARNSSWHIWGCQTWPVFTSIALAVHVGANARAADDQDVEIDSGSGNNVQQTVTTRRDVRRMAAQAFTNLSYAGALAAHLAARVSGPKVFASMPGSWASFTRNPAAPAGLGRSFFVAKDVAFEVSQRYFRDFEPEFAKRLRFSSGIDGVRYVDYVPMRDVPVPPPRPRAEHFFFRKRESLALYDWAFGQLANLPFVDGKAVKADRFDRIPVRLDLATGRVLPVAANGRPAILYIRAKRGTTSENAYAVSVNGPRVDVHRIKRGASGEFDEIERAVRPPFGVP